MLKIRPIGVLLGCTLALNAIPGNTIQSDLGSPVDDGTYVGNNLFVAQSFTPTTAYTLTAVTVDLTNAPYGEEETAQPVRKGHSMSRSARSGKPPSRAYPAPVTPYTIATLYADNATFPGTALAVSPTQVLDTQLSGTPQQFTFTFSYPLAANARYWIGLSSPNGSTSFWSASDSATGTDVSTEFYEIDNGVNSIFDTGDAFLLAVFGSAAAPVTPAPATLWLALIGLAGAALYLGRKRLFGLES